MKRLFIFLAILLVSGGVYSKGVGNDANIQATSYPDGIEFNVSNPDVDLQLTVSGPGSLVYKETRVNTGPVFLDINNANGKKLADGLYKYEARPVPVIMISRSESSKMPDRNVLHGKSAPKISPFSGSFRVVNGKVADPNLNEFASAAPQESAK